MSVILKADNCIKELDQVNEADRDCRRLLKMYYVLPDGYQIRTLAKGCYHLIRKSDGGVVARMDDQKLLLKKLEKESFVCSIYEHDEWEALHVFYSYCYWMAVKGIYVLADSRAGGGGKTAFPVSVTDR